MYFNFVKHLDIIFVVKKNGMDPKYKEFFQTNKKEEKILLGLIQRKECLCSEIDCQNLKKLKNNLKINYFCPIVKKTKS